MAGSFSVPTKFLRAPGDLFGFRWADTKELEVDPVLS
jgi:hypothetical protein